MIEKAQKFMLLVLAAGALAIGGAVVANAASDGSGSSGSGSGAQSQAPQRQDETELSGETADKVRAAALEEVPGGTIIRLETRRTRRPRWPDGRPCDRDGDGNRDGDSGSGSGSNGNQGTDFTVPGSSDQI